MKHVFALVPFALLAACFPDPPPPPPISPNPPGSVYRATGMKQPAWEMTIDEREIVFTDRATNASVAQPTPTVIGGFAGEIYQTPRIGVNIVHHPCTDGVTGRAYRDRVTVDVDGRRYEGCGGY